MRPLDKRLLRHARSTRSFLVTTVVIGALTAGLVIVQAFLLAGVIVAGFVDGAGLASQRGALLALSVVIVGRALLAWLSEVSAHAAAARAKSELRLAVLDHAVELGPVWLAGNRSGELTTLTTRGVDALDGYFAKYLPQLVLAAVVPAAVLVAIGTQDLLSAVLVAATLPLIPVFMVVIGIFTRRHVDRQWTSLAVLSGHFLDVVAGLPTLKLFGRAAAQEASIRAVGEQYRTTTMGVLRVSFLSALVLELIATLSVAVVAVAIGLRLVYGDMTLAAGLTVLLLAPEAYLPIRMVGQQFHAAAEGVGAAERMLAVLDAPVPMAGGAGTVADLRTADLVISDLSVTYPGRDVPALARCSTLIRHGAVTAVAGVNGSGKSTLLAVLMGFVGPDSGAVQVRSGGAVTRLADVDPQAWRAQVSYLPQSPYLGSGTLAQAVRLGSPAATDAEVLDALRMAGLDVECADAARTLPQGLDTAIGEDGVGLSAGQARRVALARTLCRDTPLVLLDEPSAALDTETEEIVVRALGALRRRGRTVVVVAHRPALLLAADEVITLPAPAGEVEDEQSAAPVPMVGPTAGSLVGTGAPAWTERA